MLSYAEGSQIEAAVQRPKTQGCVSTALYLCLGMNPFSFSRQAAYKHLQITDLLKACRECLDFGEGDNQLCILFCALLNNLETRGETKAKQFHASRKSGSKALQVLKRYTWECVNSQFIPHYEI
jgi:hypothetical protein